MLWFDHLQHEQRTKAHCRFVPAAVSKVRWSWNFFGHYYQCNPGSHIACFLRRNEWFPMNCRSGFSSQDGRMQAGKPAHHQGLLQVAAFLACHVLQANERNQVSCSSKYPSQAALEVGAPTLVPSSAPFPPDMFPYHQDQESLFPYSYFHSHMLHLQIHLGWNHART